MQLTHALLALGLLLSGPTFASCARLSAGRMVKEAVRVDQGADTTPRQTYTFDFKNFNALETRIAADIVYEPGPRYAVALEATPKERDRMRLDTQGNTLVLENKASHQTNNSSGHLPTLRITAPDLCHFKLQGVGCFSVAQGLAQERLDCTVQGVYTLRLPQIKVKTCTLNLQGVTEIDVDARQVDRFELNQSGVSKGRLRVQGHTCVINNDGVAENLAADIDCQRLQSKGGGVGQVQLSGHAGSIQINAK